jgi:hypothetical protein
LTASCLLDTGKLTLTKIKEAFAIMKGFVVEARSNQSSNEKSSSIAGVMLATPSSSAGNEAEEVLLKQIHDLKSSLLQREHEIAILVNMVKKGVSIDNASSSRTNSAGSEATAAESSKTISPRASTNLNMDAKASASAAGLKSLQIQQREREQAREELIIKRHLFGVPPPPDKAIFDDAAGKLFNDQFLTTLD